VAWASREQRPRETTEDRFRRVAEITLSALRAIGIDAEIGETPGEYCPGRWSIKAKGKKVAGFGQRIVRGGAHVGGVIVVSNPQLVNLPLIPAYAELGYKWEPGATGSLSQSTPDLTTDQIITSLSAALADSINDVLPARPENRTISLARQLVHEHVPPE
jgi:octanoyl-[GcvH]:protein N-octanoyltransferase